MEKLGQLHQEVRANGGRGGPRWDLIVVDTPPSRSALDFLDAPKRLGLVPRRPVHPAALGAGQGRRPRLAQGLQRRHRPGLLDAVPGPRRPDAARRPDLRRRARHDVRRVPRSAPTRRMRCWPSARRPSSSSPRPSATPCVRRPTSSRGSRRADAARRPRGQPRPAGAGARARAPARGRAAAEERSRRRRPPDARACCACTRTRRRRGPAAASWPTVLARPPSMPVVRGAGPRRGRPRRRRACGRSATRSPPDRPASRMRRHGAT